jgi:hypothetical protein
MEVPMTLRLLKLALAGAAALSFAAAAPARADDSTTDDKAEHDTDDDTAGKPADNDTHQGGTNTDHADPSTKTLPSHASATAKANAFGQQGAREKAAHAAARAAAVKAAHHDVDAANPTLPAQANGGRGHAQSTGKPSSPGEHGLEIAASHRSSHANPHGH